LKPDRAVWKVMYSLYAGAMERANTMEPAQIWEWFFTQAGRILEDHDNAPFVQDMTIAIHSELERQLETQGEGGKQIECCATRS